MAADKKRWDIIAQIIKENDYTNCAEIGVKSGRNVQRILAKCPKAHFICIDPWTPNEDYAHWTPSMFARHEQEFEEVRKSYSARITKIKAFSQDCADQIDEESLDLLFIDGDHSYEGCKRDIELYLSKVRPGGVICGHDYKNFNHPRHGNKFAGVTTAVDEAFNGRVVESSDHVWIVYL